MGATGGWPRSCMALTKRSPNSSIASSWQLGDSSKFRPTGLSCILINGRTIRSCAKRPLIRRVSLFPGCTISPSPLRTHNLSQGRWESVSHFLAAKIGADTQSQGGVSFEHLIEGFTNDFEL